MAGLEGFEFFKIIVEKSSSRQRLPDKFAKMLDVHEPQKVKLREAGSGHRRLWDVVVVFNKDGHMYLGCGWEQFVRAHDLRLGHFLVLSYDGDAVLTVKVFNGTMCCRHYQHDDDASSGSSSYCGYSNSSIDYGYSNNRSDRGYNNSSSRDEEERSGEEEEQSGDEEEVQPILADDDLAMVVDDDDLAMVVPDDDIAMVVPDDGLAMVVPDDDLAMVVAPAIPQLGDRTMPIVVEKYIPQPGNRTRPILGLRALSASG